MIAFFDCVSGVSGDMCLGALLSLGAPLSVLTEGLIGLSVPGLAVRVTDVKKHGIAAKKVTVTVTEHLHHERRLSDILGIIEKSDLGPRVKSRASAIFLRLGQAEAKVHGISKDEVHFHEVGAIDAIADVVGTVILLEHFKVDQVAASVVPLGSGFVSCAHGVIPVPAPATIELLSGIPCYGTGISAELVTPTGAAILTTLSESYGPLPFMKITAVGYGAGDRDLSERPNVLRVMLGKPENKFETDRVCVLEANIDDMAGERFGYVMERLFDSGALDVTLTPCLMKKSRPAILLTVLCEPGLLPQMTSLVFSETTTIGMRVSECSRLKLPRTIVTIQTEYGPVAAKLVDGPDAKARLTPEYESCRAKAKERNVPLEEIYKAVWKQEK